MARRYQTPDGMLFSSWNKAFRHTSLISDRNAQIEDLEKSIKDVTEDLTIEQDEDGESLEALRILPKRDGWEEQYLPRRDKHGKELIRSIHTGIPKEDRAMQAQRDLVSLWKRTATLLEKDIERLRKDYDDGKKEIRQLKASKTALAAIKERLEGELGKRNRDLAECIAEIKRLKILTSKDNVIHTRVLPPLVIKRPYKGG